MNASLHTVKTWRLPLLGVFLLGAFCALALVWGSAAGIFAPANARHALAAVGLCAMSGLAALWWIAREPRLDRAPLALVLLIALVLRVLAGFALPLLEDDFYRYLWDGYRTATTLNPYALSPSAFVYDFDLPAPWQHILLRINYPELPTIYGPVLQYLFALAHAIAPARVEVIQALLIGVDMGILVLLARQGVGARITLAYAVHPLVLKEAIASAHPDGLMALFLLLALLAWQGKRMAWVGVCCALAVGTKVVALAALPFLLWPARGRGPGMAERGRVVAGRVLACLLCFVATLCAIYLPLVWRGSSELTSLRIFADHWQFNPLMYRILQHLTPADLVRPVAGLTMAAAVALLWLRARRRASLDDETVQPLHFVFACVMLLSPVVNPWYWLWALPFFALYQRRGWMLALVVPMASYLNSTVAMQSNWQALAPDAAPFWVPWPVTLLQLAVLAAAWHLGRLKPGQHAHHLP